MFKEFKKMIAVYLAIIFFIGLDRLFKVMAMQRQGDGFNIIGDIFKFNFKANYYIAFSLPLAGQALEILIVLIILGLAWFWLKTFSRRGYDKLTALAAIILGAGSNLFDRLRYGYVVDYLDFKYFTVFNLADIMIISGVAWLLLIIKNNKYE